MIKGTLHAEELAREEYLRREKSLTCKIVGVAQIVFSGIAIGLVTFLYFKDWISL
jgi:hypothetical protein